MTRVVAVVGPTATGKSDFGVALAKRTGGEVINADSMQLYVGMDVGTAKLSLVERGGVPHHLLDIWPVTRTASVASYQGLARAAIERVQSAGRLPILVGGSGLYVRAVLDDLVFPGTDDDVRTQLEAELSVDGPDALHARLAAADPAAANVILPSNGRRIVRALEALAIGGRSFTGAMPPRVSVYDAVLIGLDVDTPELDARVTTRVDAMWARGLVDEVRHLADVGGLRSGVTARRALGYRQVLAMFDGMFDEVEARARTIQATKRFVRRQRSWFRPDPRVHWMRSDSLERALELIA